jgi:xanthine dehydrogenase accessory factor
VLVEPVIPKPLLVIAGGGHIGQALARQASIVGFDVTILDDRAEFTDPALFPEDTRTICGDIPKKVANLSSGSDTYIVVVTRGHKLDAEALEACIHAPVAYVGMIGSSRKVSLIRRNFIETGLATEEEFNRVFTPIGLDIGAVTVPEIAASITAELIAVRRKGLTHKSSNKAESS